MHRRPLSAALAIVLACSTGCAPTIGAQSPPATPASAQECRELDASQQSWGTAALWSLLVAAVGASVGFAVHDDGGKTSQAAFAVGAAGGYVGALTYGMHSRGIRAYGEKGCGAAPAAPPKN